MQLAEPSRWILAPILLIGALTGCSRKTGGDEEEASGNPETVVVEVTVTRVARAEINQTLAVSGTIAALPNQDVRVSALVQGRITAMMVAEGDHVTQGQALAKVDDHSYLDQVRQAEASVEQARASLENARLNRTRNEDLFKRGIAARKELEDARTQESVSAAALNQVEASLAIARLQVARTEVRSPLSGTVVKRFTSAGEQVDGTSGQPLFEVANLREAELYGNVPAVYLGRIHVGEQLVISTEAFPGRKFAGRVVAISPAVDPSTNVGLVRIRIPNDAGLLRLGMFLGAQVPLETHPHALTLPASAIYRDPQGQPRVYRVNGDAAEAVAVKLGVDAQDRVEILTGVKEGETVILTGGYGLGDHVKVKVKPM